MSVSISSYPPPFAAARSPMFLRVYSDTWQTQPTSNASGTLNVAKINFDHVPSAGSIITITNGFGTVELECAGSAGDAGLHFRQGTDEADQAAKFAEDAARNYDLITRYHITSVGTYVLLRGRDFGDDYNPTSITCDEASVITVTNLYTSQDFIYQDNFSLTVRPRIADDTQPFGWRTLPEFSGEPDTLKGVDFNLSKKLRPFLSPDFPDYQTSGYAFRHTKSVKAYLVEYFARQGDPAAPLAVHNFGTESAPKYAWLASYKDRDKQDFDSFVNRFTGVTGTPPHFFLTWRNRKAPRYVTVGEQHHLGWFHWPTLEAATSFDVQAKLYLTDGTSVDWSTRYSFNVDTDGIPRGELGTICAGYTHLNIAALVPSGKTPLRYSVRVYSMSGPKSEEIDFWLVDSGFNDQYIWFTSSLGCTESLRCTGQWVKGVNHTFTEVQRPFTRDDVGVASTSTFASETDGGQAFLEVFTGYHAQEEHNALRDILNAPRFGLLHCDYETGRLLPLRLVESEELIEKRRGFDDEHLYGFKLRFLADDPENAVTMVPTGAEVVHNEEDSESEGGG